MKQTQKKKHIFEIKLLRQSMEHKKRIFNALKNSSSDSVIKFKDVLKSNSGNVLIFLLMTTIEYVSFKGLSLRNDYIVSTAENADQAKKKIKI